MTSNIARWQERIHRIKEELLALGEMRPGALSEQYNVCGKPNCRCKAPRSPKKHGPYYQISYSHHGKSTTEFVKREKVAEVRQQLATYARFRKLVDEWVTLSLRLAKLRR
jgi:hypothetical protein